MDEQIRDAMGKVLGMFRTNMKEDEALKFSQAFLNLAHGQKQLKELKQSKGA